METLVNFISAIIGGLIVWVVQQYYQNKRENKKSNFIKLNQAKKIIDPEIVYSLKPGMHIDLMREHLGNPMKIFKEDNTVFNEKIVETNSFLYSFKNANIKVTSKNNQSIDTLTVFPKDSTFEIGNYTEDLNFNSNKLNKARVNSKLISNSEHTFLAARHDSTFAFNYSIPNPFYLKITLFGTSINDFHEYFDKQNPELFLNGLITGICISDYNEEAYYIYQYELR
jgi:hypothetical protein